MVADNGMGIGSEYLDKIFKYVLQGFARIQRLWTWLVYSERDGDKMTGKITLHSETGSGSEFRIVLPLH